VPFFCVCISHVFNELSVSMTDKVWRRHPGAKKGEDLLLTRRCLQRGQGKVVGLGSFRQEAEGA
jgi:hypothetical protein